MPNTHETLTSLFSDIADAIRAKTGDTADIIADDFPDAIAEIETGAGVIEPLTVTENGTYTAPAGVDGYDPVNVNVPNPSTGRKTITDTNVTDVTDYAEAQVVDANLAAGNIKKDVTILGVTGTYEGGGGGGNYNRVKILNSHTIIGDEKTVPLDVALSTTGLEMVIAIVAFPTAAAANIGIYYGFTSSDSPTAAEEQEAYMGVRSGETVGVCAYFPPKMTNGLPKLNVGFSAIGSIDAYNVGYAVGYSRVPGNNTTKLAIHTPASLAGATVEMYAYYKL